MKNTNVSHLKAHLSQYLSEVRRGETVIVLDRETPIARIVPYSKGEERLCIRKADRPVSDLFTGPGIRLLKPVDILALLSESRDER